MYLDCICIIVECMYILFFSKILIGWIYLLHYSFVPVHEASEGFMKQFLNVATSAAVVVHVVLSHFPASTEGIDVVALYVPIVQYRELECNNKHGGYFYQFLNAPSISIS